MQHVLTNLSSHLKMSETQISRFPINSFLLVTERIIAYKRSFLIILLPFNLFLITTTLNLVHIWPELLHMPPLSTCVDLYTPAMWNGGKELPSHPT